MTTNYKYLLQPDFDQSKFYAPNKTLFMDDRIMEDKRGGRDAVTLFGAFKDQVELSKNTANKKYRDENWNYYGVFPYEAANFCFRIGRTKYYQHKKLLKEAGLIQYAEQDVKEEGEASRIYVTPWEEWVEQNGLYSHGEWIVRPSSKDFYNPAHIVTVQPNIQEEIMPTKNVKAEFDDLMDKCKKLAVKFHKAGCMRDVHLITRNIFGEGKKITSAELHDLPKLRRAHLALEETWAEIDEMESIN